MGRPAFEDKMVQRAVAMLLGAIYEQDCRDGSYGFREGRSPHQALHVGRERGMHAPISWIVDADGRAFFDSLDHDQWGEVLTPRGKDGAILRLMRKGLKAGVVAGDTLSSPERGSPQGGVRSPGLANRGLDHVLDAWCEREVRPRMQGRCVLIRDCDDVVMGGARADDARRMLVALPTRFARFTRTLPPQKTRLVQCQPPRRQDGGERGDGTFDVLGLTHDWAPSRRGYGVIKRRTARQRLRRAAGGMALVPHAAARTDAGTIPGAVPEAPRA